MDQEQHIDNLGTFVNDREEQEPKELNIDEAVLPIRLVLQPLPPWRSPHREPSVCELSSS